jgi:hypothetical protein
MVGIWEANFNYGYGRIRILDIFVGFEKKTMFRSRALLKTLSTVHCAL